MKNNNAISIKKAPKFLIAMLLFVSPLSLSYAACCAGHGGVASCNKITGVQMCKDGTASPTCKCSKAKTPKTTSTTTAPATSTSTTTTTPVKKPVKKPASKPTTTQPMTTKPSSTPATSSKPANTDSTSHKGCCSKHGGISQCNKSTGYLTCKDGSQSASCGCH